MIQITNTRPEHIAHLVAHQQRCFPTICADDLINAEMFAAQLAIFPEGQHVVLDGTLVVGQSSTFRIGSSCLEQHTYRGITANNYFTRHDPDGEWLYGADMSVHPDYRGQHIATRLYTVRKELIRSLGMRGIVIGGGLPGFHQYAAHMSVEAYVAAVADGRLIDATLTPQLKNGFVLRGVLRDYVDGGELLSDHAALLVWEA